MKFTLPHLHPWADAANLFTRARTLKIYHGDKELGPDAEFKMDDNGNLSIHFPAHKPSWGKAE